MAVENFQVPFTKLNSANYVQWSKRAQVWLEAKEVWADYVQRRKPFVAVAADATAEQEAAAHAQNREHDKMDTKARCMLMVSIDDSQLPHVENLRSAFEIWEALRRIHHRATIERGGTSRQSCKEASQVSAMASKSCFRCGSRFHLIAKCPEKQQEFQQSKVSFRSYRGRRSESYKNQRSRGGAGADKGLSAMAAQQSPKRSQQTLKWIIDSGASHSLVPATSSGSLKNCKTLPVAKTVTIADNSKREMSLKGTIYVNCLQTNLPVFVLPGMKNGLLSVSCLVKSGFKVEFENDVCTISKQGKELVKIPCEDGLFVLDEEQLAAGRCSTGEAQAKCVNKAPHTGCAHLLHRRLAHICFKYVSKMPDLAEECNIKPCPNFLDCCACKHAKVKTCNYPRSDRVSKKPFELVHTDVCGPMPVKSLGGARFMQILVDDFSRASWVFFLKEKSQAASILMDWIEEVECKFDTRVRKIQSDRGGEYVNHTLETWLKRKGIVHRLTNPYSPQENAVAERKFRTLQEAIAALLFDSGLPQRFWAEAALYANYTFNRVYNSTVGNTPYFMLFGKKPKIDHLRVFGCRAYVLVPRAQRRKGDPRSKEMLFCGYQANTKGWRFVNVEGNQTKITISRSAEFCEQDGWNKIHGNPDILFDVVNSNNETQAPGQVLVPEQAEEFESEDKGEKSFSSPKSVKSESSSSKSSPVQQESVKSESESSSTTSDKQVTTSDSGSEGETEGTSQELLRRSKRANKGIPPERYQAISVWAGLANCEPESFEEVEQLPQEEASRWREAMQKELNSMKELGVFSITKLPEGTKAVSCRWVYRIKTTAMGKPEYKARLVARGFTQREGLHYSEVYAPTSRSETLRALLAVAAQKGFKVNQFDVSTAYLHSDLAEELYMELPPGLKVGKSNQVWKLHKSIYGLKQSAHNWNECLNDVLVGIGFSRSKADNCLYFRGSGDAQESLLVYVDDLIYTSKTQEQVKKLAKELNKHFKVKNLGDVKVYLGVQIDRTKNGSFLLNQKGKILQMLKKFGMTECAGVRTPMEMGFVKDNEFKDSAEFKSAEIFQSALGSLLHLSQWSRPDIAYAVNLLSREASKPSVNAWKGIQRVLRYLQYTKDFCLELSSEGQAQITCWADSDWANLKDRKSVSGCVIKFGNSLIGWRSKKQNLIALSSTEAEFCALSELCRDLEFYKCLAQEMYEKAITPITVWGDNQPCLKLAQNGQFKGRTKHLDIRFQNVCQTVKAGIVKLNYCPSHENQADGFTKPLGFQRHENFCEEMGLK